MISAIHPIPAFRDNYIWALHEAGSARVAVVDPGDARPVREYLEQGQLTLSHILITHHHPDHVGGLATLKQAGEPQVFGPGTSGIQGIDTVVAEGDTVNLFGLSFQVLEVPGHTLDHLAYFASPAGRPPLLFCGDTLFAAGCGRLFEGTPDMMHQSLARLKALPPDTEVYCTHEYTLANLRFAAAADGDNPLLRARVEREQAKRAAGRPTLPSTVGLERDTNPFLRAAEPAIRRLMAEREGRPLTQEAEVFAALRHWKDSF